MVGKISAPEAKQIPTQSVEGTEPLGTCVFMALINSFVGGILAADIIIKGNKCVTHGHTSAKKTHIYIFSERLSQDPQIQLQQQKQKPKQRHISEGFKLKQKDSSLAYKIVNDKNTKMGNTHV